MALKLPTAPYNTAKALYAGRSMLRFVRTATFTAAVSEAGTFDLADHGFENGNTVRFVSGTAGLTEKEIYYIVNAAEGTFQLSLTYGGEAVTATVGATNVFQKAHCIGLKEVTIKNEPEYEEYEEPGSDGINYVVDSRVKVIKQSKEFTLPETLRLLELFDGQLSGMVEGTATMFIPDPQRDAPNTIALVTEEDYPAKLTVGGDIKTGGGFSAPTLTLKSMKAGAIKYIGNAQIVAG